MKITMPLPLLNFPVCTHKILAGCIALFILMQAFIPRFVVTGNDSRVLSQIIETQSILFKFFSLSTVPLQIVGDLFNEPSRRAAPVKQPRQHESSGPNSSTDFFLTQGESWSQTVRWAGQLLPYSVAATGSHQSEGVRASLSQCLLPSHLPPGFYWVFLFIFLVLPRNNVGEYARALFSVAGLYAQRVGVRWVFSLFNSYSGEGSLSWF